MEFESQIGDLPSITKVEKRRLAVQQQLKDSEGREASLLVDRYKFMDLLPGSGSELRCIGYKVTCHLTALHSFYMGTAIIRVEFSQYSQILM